MASWRSILQREFNAEEGSFLLQLRCGPGWNWAAFHELFLAMRECCKGLDGEAFVERWIAEGFWYLSWFPRQTVHRWPADKQNIYNGALANLDHLALWLFVGESRGDDGFEPMSDAS
jgi:hypothetical protein